VRDPCKHQTANFNNDYSKSMKATAGNGVQGRFRRIVNHIFSLSTALILFWKVVLFWGELWVFEERVSSCQWQGWETWVSSDNKTSAPTANAICSLLQPSLIMCCSLLILNSSIRIHILDDRGLYRV
jgi:hypothetical protein